MATTSAPGLLDILVSEGYQIYTEVTSILGTMTQEPTSEATSTSSRSSRTSTSSRIASTISSSPRSSFSSASSTATSASSTNPSSTIAGAAVVQSSAAAATQGSGHGSGHNKLAIILGSVLGALALGLLILAILLCCRRRRRRRSERSSLRNGALLPGDDEVSSWKYPTRKGHGYASHHETAAGTGPLMTEHRRSHENPFTPVPPPPRRSAPNSRAGLTDGMIPGDDPYLMEHGSTKPISGSRSRSSSGHGKALALGAGGAALGAAAMHHHHKKSGSQEDLSAPVDRPHSISRKPVPERSLDHGASKGDWPYETPPPIHDSQAAIPADCTRQSIDSARSRHSRDAARANAVFDNEYAPTTESVEPLHSHNNTAHTAAALGAGALAGAALEHHHHKDHNVEQDLRPTTLAQTRNRYSTSSTTSTDSTRYYANALAHDHQSNHRPTSVHDVPYTIPPTPPTRSRRNSALGTNAPPAALGSYINSPPPLPTTRPHSLSSHSHTRSRSRSSSHSPHIPPPPAHQHLPDDTHSDNYAAYTPTNLPQPPLPTRSSARPISRPGSEYNSDQSAPFTSPPDQRSPSPPYTPKSIVGDNGYPHMNVPRRRSGSVHDYNYDVGTGDVEALPPAVSGRRVPAQQFVDDGGAGGGSGSGSGSGESEDSAWRLSMGMPGGWQRAQQQRGFDGGFGGSVDGWTGGGGGERFGGGNGYGPANGYGNGNGNGRMRREMMVDDDDGYGQGYGHGYAAGGGGAGVGQAL